MNDRSKPNRRTVLKTLGAGAIGATAVTESAIASSCGVETTVKLKGHQFLPRNASVSLGGEGGCAKVKYVNKEPLIDGHEVPHDVHIHGTKPDGSSAKISSAIFYKDESYTVELSEETTGELTLTETGGKVGTQESTTVGFSGGSVTLDVHCSLHEDFTNMVGTLEVSR